jgi:hypothetical protein
VAISPAPLTRPPLIRLTVLVVSVALIGLALTWSYLGMRSIMDIGGACATGGPYVPVQPCPEGASVLLSVAIPLLILATFLATAVAVMLGAPTLILPMWVLLFGALGWNFLEYAFSTDGGVVVGWLVCGIVFEAMALPAAALLVVTGSTRVPGLGVAQGGGGPWRWWMLYAVTGVAGYLLGAWSFRSWT